MKEYSSYLNQIFPAVMALNWAYNTASYWENVFLTSQTPLELTCKIVWIAALLLQEFYCLFGL